MLRNSASGPEIGLPGQILAGLLPVSHKIGPPAGRRPAGLSISVFPRCSPAKIRPRRPIYGPEALLRNIEYLRKEIEKPSPSS